MAQKEKDKEKRTAEKQGIGVYTAVGIAIVAVALFAIGANYFAGQGNGGTLANQTTAADPLDTDAGRILLKSYDAGAALSNYRLNYSMDDNGASTRYVLASSGNQSFASVYGTFGVMSGYFLGGNGSDDIICLTYGATERCARVSSNEAAQSILDNLKILRPDRNSYLNQKADIKKLVNAGAVKLSPLVEDAKIGQFETSKIKYAVDYRGLTVEKLGAAGISPNDESIYSVTEVTYWMEKKTGLMVKSHAAIDNKGAKSYFDVDYSDILLDNAKIPPTPGQIYDVTDFLKFYKLSADDYTGKERCAAMQGTERDSCYRSLAMDKKDIELCKKIAVSLEYERCALYVAQGTGNPAFCGNLTKFGDDCYISIVSQNGNAELCKKLKNESLTRACADAVAAGKKLQDAVDAAAEQRALGRNCAESSGCRVDGAYKQYCIPKNATLAPTADETQSILHGCYSNLTCGCYDNYCRYNKTDAYYGCVSAIEEDMLREFIGKLADSANQTDNNGTNTSEK